MRDGTYVATVLCTAAHLMSHVHVALFATAWYEDRY